ncbi:allatostatin-A receptor-like [Lytechinus pictus]|uniref:allatostatin-A receptor-like n=1 Tax=Lytechinus pictus TaxID=7653 RepID=UPI0030B9DB25
MTSRDLTSAATSRNLGDHTSASPSNPPAIDGSTNHMSTESTGSSSVKPRNKSDATYPTSLDQTTEGTGHSAPEDIIEDISSVSPVLADGNETLSGWYWYGMEWHWYLIIQAISGIVGIVGNLLVILVLFQRRSSGRSTDTLIGGLAWADFLTSIFIIPIPNEQRIPATWFGDMYCKLIHTSYFLWVSVNASTYILMAISIERFIAITYPIYFNRVLTKSRIQFVILIIWILSVLSSIFAFFVEFIDPTTNRCMFSFPSPESQVIIGYYWFFLRMVIPMLTMLITQTLIARELHRQSIRFKSDKDSSTTKTVHLVARNRVLKMMFEVIIIYIICWAPNLIAYMGTVMGFVPPSYLGSPLHHTLTVLGFCNSCANPFIYTVRHPQFREALKGMLTCVRGGTSPLFEQKMESSYASRTFGQGDQTDVDKEV